MPSTRRVSGSTAIRRRTPGIESRSTTARSESRLVHMNTRCRTFCVAAAMEADDPDVPIPGVTIPEARLLTGAPATLPLLPGGEAPSPAVGPAKACSDEGRGHDGEKGEAKLCTKGDRQILQGEKPYQRLTHCDVLPL